MVLKYEVTTVMTLPNDFGTFVKNISGNYIFFLKTEGLGFKNCNIKCFFVVIFVLTRILFSLEKCFTVQKKNKIAVRKKIKKNWWVERKKPPRF